MSRPAKLTLFKNFRHERMLGAWLAVVLLLVPFLHPLAEANAAPWPDAGFICSSFGSSTNSTTPAQADDCPFGITCAGLAVAAVPPFANLDTLEFHRGDFAAARVPVAIFINPLPAWESPPGHAPPLSL